MPVFLQRESDSEKPGESANALHRVAQSKKGKCGILLKVRIPASMPGLKVGVDETPGRV